MTERRSGVWAYLVCLALAVTTTVPDLQAQRSSPAGHEELIYAIYLTRHGVRSPTGTAAQYNQFSSAQWPEWNVPPGYLTAHGYELMRLFGGYDRERLARLNLLRPEGCQDAKHVTIHADSDQRTRETAKALAEGMFPECDVAINAKADGTNDPLFQSASGQHFTRAGQVRYRCGSGPDRQ